MFQFSKKSSYVLVALFATAILSSHQGMAYAQSNDHIMTSDQSHLPTANIGNRQLALEFTTNPAAALPKGQIDLNLSLIDKNTGNNAPHVTYTIIITREEDDKQVFNELVHGHDGKVTIRYIDDPSAQTYRVSANYDTLSASYVSDFGSPIKVEGQVFSVPGTYKVSIDVIGIDFDNTFLPQPLKYNFILPVLSKQTFPVKYQDKAFNVGIYTTETISKAELNTESRQLIISLNTTTNSTSSAATANATKSSSNENLGDHAIKLEIPKEMMSGPFSATLSNGAVLDLKEDTTADHTATVLMLTAKHDNMTQAGGSSSSNSNNNTSADSPQKIIITAANVIPEFPIGIVGSIAVIGFAAIIVYGRISKPDKRFF